MTIQPDGLYLILIDIGQARVQLGLGSQILHEGKFQSRRTGKWSRSTNLPVWVTQAGYAKYPLGNGMCYLIRPITVHPELTWSDALATGLAGMRKYYKSVKFYTRRHNPTRVSL